MLNNQNPATTSVLVNKNELANLFENLREFVMEIRKTAGHTMDGNIDRVTQNLAHIERTSEQLIYQILFAKDALNLTQQ